MYILGSHLPLQHNLVSPKDHTCEEEKERMWGGNSDWRTAVLLPGCTPPMFTTDAASCSQCILHSWSEPPLLMLNIVPDEHTQCYRLSSYGVLPGNFHVRVRCCSLHRGHGCASHCPRHEQRRLRSADRIERSKENVLDCWLGNHQPKKV